MDDFDALVASAKQQNSPQGQDQLWRAVYRLEQWHFVARGELPNVAPFVGMRDGKPFLMAFTDRLRAQNWAGAQGLAAQDGTATVLSIPEEQFIQTADSYLARGVFGISFNTGANGFFAPLANLVPMLQHFRGRETTG